MKMPNVNPDDSQQNAWVQSWLAAWASKHTVYGTGDWMLAACKKIVDDPEHAKKWELTPAKEIRDAETFEAIIEHIQETYNYDDHQQREGGPHEEPFGTVWVLTTFKFDRVGSGNTVIDQEVFDKRPRFPIEKNMILRVANINGGDSAPA
jgi:hypothetical protein